VSPARVGFVGLGSMGGRMVKRLLATHPQCPIAIGAIAVTDESR